MWVWLGGWLDEWLDEWLDALLRVSDEVFLSKRRHRLCGPTDPKAARTCSTSSTGKRTGLLLTPPWKAPTQVGPGGPRCAERLRLSAPSESRRGTGVRNWSATGRNRQLLHWNLSQARP